MRWLNKILKIICKEKTEIEYVEAAIKRYRRKLFDLSWDFDHTKDCCLDCRSGGDYTRLLAKIERVEKWLIILKKRKNKTYK